MARSRVIIMGGGVIGLSTAYHLASRRYGDVILLEKGSIGDGSSSRAAGIITGLLWDEPGVLARKKSLQLFRQLSEELRDYRFASVGCLNLFDRQSWPDREKLLPLYERLDAPYEIMSGPEIRRRWPALVPGEDVIGLFDPLGGYSEPDEYIPALAARCAELGVDIRERQQARGFLVRSGRIWGVRTAEGELEADAVVCTVHAWTLKALEELGIRLPFKNFVHQRYLSRPLSQVPSIPAVNANHLSGYVRPASRKRVLVGIETADREEYPVKSIDFEMCSVTGPSKETGAGLLQKVSTLMPVLGNERWEEEKVGLISFSLDGSPILGPLSAWPGLFVALAFHSGGFAYNPVVGLLLSEFVKDGVTSVGVSAFSPDRFNEDETEAYLSRSTIQAQAIRRRH